MHNSTRMFFPFLSRTPVHHDKNYFSRPSIRSGAYFGGVNPDLFWNTPQCFDVTKEHYWQTGMRRMGFKWGAKKDLPVDWITDDKLDGDGAPKSIFWDTGTTWNAGPTYLTRYIISYLDKKGFAYAVTK